MFGPIHARGDQGNGRRIHQMDGALELAGKALARAAADKTWRPVAQMLQDRPEKLFGHVRRTHFVGVGQGVAVGRGGTAQTGERPRVQPQCVAHIVEANAVSELGIHQGDQMTPGAEGAGFGLNPGSPRQFWHQEVRNEVANLPQQVHLCGGWNVLVVFFHPCRVAGLRKTFQLFSKSCGMAVKKIEAEKPKADANPTP